MDKFGLMFGLGGQPRVKKSKESATVPVHLAFNWDGLKSNSAYFFFDPTFINSELALNQ